MNLKGLLLIGRDFTISIKQLVDIDEVRTSGKEDYENYRNYRSIYNFNYCKC